MSFSTNLTILNQMSLGIGIGARVLGHLVTSTKSAENLTKSVDSTLKLFEILGFQSFQKASQNFGTLRGAFNIGTMFNIAGELASTDWTNPLDLKNLSNISLFCGKILQVWSYADRYWIPPRSTLPVNNPPISQQQAQNTAQNTGVTRFFYTAQQEIQNWYVGFSYRNAAEGLFNIGGLSLLIVLKLRSVDYQLQNAGLAVQLAVLHSAGKIVNVVIRKFNFCSRQTINSLGSGLISAGTDYLGPLRDTLNLLGKNPEMFKI
ncbi:MAG: hypothetical protein Tsb0021_01910 [Chlamydiales bacterium]